MPIELIVKFAVPVLVTVTAIGLLVTPTSVLGKFNEVVLNCAVGTASPVPYKLTTCGVSGALSLNVKLPV